MIIYTDPQGSEEWLARRVGVITGSRFKDARDKLKNGKPSGKQDGYAQDLARERVGGKAPKVFVNDAMRQGTEQEPFARAAYESVTGCWVDEAGFITTDDGQFGVSVDGLVGTDGIIEIKTMVSSSTLFTAVVERDISEYIDQCNGAMWLLGRQWVDLILWAPDLADIGRDLTVIRIERDDDAINALEADLIAFWKRVNALEAKLRGVTPATPATPAATEALAA
jgi:hypothetical protein